MKNFIRAAWIFILGLIQIQAISLKDRSIQLKLAKPLVSNSESTVGDQPLGQFSSLFQGTAIDKIDALAPVAKDQSVDMMETFGNLFKSGKIFFHHYSSFG